MAGVTGLEPATFCVTGRRSNQLSYTPIGLTRYLIQNIKASTFFKNFIFFSPFVYYNKF